MSNNQIDFNNFLDKTNNQNNVSIGVFSFLMVVVIMLCFLIPFIIHNFFDYLINSLIAKHLFKNEILDCIENVANSNDNKKKKNILENENKIRRNENKIITIKKVLKKINKIERKKNIIIFVSLCLLFMFVSILSYIIGLCRTAKKINNKLKNDSQGTLQKQKECSRFIMDYSIGMLVITILSLICLPFYFNNKNCNNLLLIFVVLIIIISIGLYSAMIHENNKILNDIEQFSV